MSAKHGLYDRSGWAIIAGPVFGLLLCLWSQSAGATESPLEVIRTTTRQARAVLDDSTYQGEAQRKKRLQKMWDVILPYFDQRGIAQRSLGVHWRGLTEAQRDRFTDLFLQLVKNSYSSTLDRYATDAQFFFDTERLDGDYAEVDTRIVTPAQPDALHVIYRLHHREGKWRVYDIIAENVSMVRNYRAQFNRILHRSSFEGILLTLEDKLAELAAS